MGNFIRAIGVSLCTLICSTISRDSAAWSEAGDFLPQCGSRVNITYVVQPGDNPWNLSQRFYGSTVGFSYENGKQVSYPRVIVRANNLQDYNLLEGQSLVIPRGGVVSGGECPANTKIRRASAYDNVRELGELNFP